MSLFWGLLPSAAICPVAVGYFLLLNDSWTIRPWLQILLALLSSPLSLLVNAAAAPLLLLLRVLCIWAVILSLCWHFSEVRDSRFLFVLFTGLMFTYLSTCWSNSVAVYFHIPRILVRAPLDSVLFLLTARLFRPNFRKVYQIPGWSWLVYSVVPLVLFFIFFGLLMMPDYTQRYALPYVQVFIHLLTALTLSFYGGSLHYFHLMGRWQEVELDWAVLNAQVAALAASTEGRETNERRRILRHDVHHYLLILPHCIQSGNTAAALETLSALDSALAQASRQEARHE